MKEIKWIFDSEETSASACLLARFKQPDRDIVGLKEQQRVIADMLKNPFRLSPSEPMTKELWTKILKSTGLSEEMMRNWHIQFAKAAPDEHRAFLQFLQISEKEIEIIRKWSN